MKLIMDKDHVMRTLRRMSHEIIETNENVKDVVLGGIKSKGTPIAKILADNIKAFEGTDINAYEIDISKYRDDEKKSDIIVNIEESLEGKVVILVDDVLYTGRSVRAAMDAVMDLGRASMIRLAVLVDRGHRELPIRADYVGKNLPTSKDEVVLVNLDDFCVFIK